MGYKTEINYILKASTVEEGQNVQNANPGDQIVIKKSGHRTFVLDSPIMLADNHWNICGMCLITETQTTRWGTLLTAKVLTKVTSDESKVLTRIIQDAEKLK